jgi:hypothetical protein
MISKSSIREVEGQAYCEIIECSAVDLWITWIQKLWSKNSLDKSKVEILHFKKLEFASGEIDIFKS